MATTFTPPADVAANAQRALDVRAEKPQSQQGMTAVGLARANQLASREAVSINTIRRMVSYFDRHEVDKQGSTWDEQGKGWQAWYGWGGDEGRTWANRILKEHESMTESTTKSLNAFSPRQRMIAAALIEVVHEEGKFDWGMLDAGAHYVDAASNPFLAENVRCEECIFYQSASACAIVQGVIDPNAICKFWVIPSSEIGFEPVVVPEYDETPPSETPPDTTSEEMKVTLTTAEREALPSEDFAIPSSRNFPITSPAAVRDAVSGWGRYEGGVSFEVFKENLIRIALRKGEAYVNALPQAWRDEMQKRIAYTARYFLGFLDS